METEFKLIFEGKPDIDLELFQRSLPPGSRAESKEDGIYLAIESALPEDETCQFLVSRELDRHFFLTAVNIRAEMVPGAVTKDLATGWRVHARLPADIGPQAWTGDLAIELRLWATAADTVDIATRMLLLYQIIETAHPEKTSYPNYNDSSVAPSPLRECKFLRDLVAHSGRVSNRQLKRYCEYLGVPVRMRDVTDPDYVRKVESKFELMHSEARKAIEAALQQSGETTHG